MKTTRNLNQTAKVTFASLTLLFASLMPMQAASNMIPSGMNEVQVASDELALFNNEVELSVAFFPPAMSEKSEAFEVYVAEAELDEMFTNAAMDAAYVSPEVHEDFEAADAVENLDSLNAQLEQSVKYVPASAAE